MGMSWTWKKNTRTPSTMKIKSRCLTLDFGYRSHEMLTAVQSFGKYYSCHLQSDCVLVVTNQIRTGWLFWQTYVGHRVKWVLDMMEMTGGGEESAAIRQKMSKWKTKRCWKNCLSCTWWWQLENKPLSAQGSRRSTDEKSDREFTSILTVLSVVFFICRHWQFFLPLDNGWCSNSCKLAAANLHALNSNEKLTTAPQSSACDRACHGTRRSLNNGTNSLELIQKERRRGQKECNSFLT
jgi:mRNA-degrading endonuclease YafQ of YafQ-DinJ toxin-antitoxin module